MCGMWFVVVEDSRLEISRSELDKVNERCLQHLVAPLLGACT